MQGSCVGISRPRNHFDEVVSVRHTGAFSGCFLFCFLHIITAAAGSADNAHTDDVSLTNSIIMQLSTQSVTLARRTTSWTAGTREPTHTVCTPVAGTDR
jgi:hypothetical protein